MRPLIEMLEDERTIIQKQESIFRYMERGLDEETFEILSARMSKTKEDMNKLHHELREYFQRLLG